MHNQQDKFTLATGNTSTKSDMAKSDQGEVAEVIGQFTSDLNIIQEAKQSSSQDSITSGRSLNMPKKLIIANWKMFGNSEKIISDIKSYVADNATNTKNVILSLPAVYLHIASSELKKYSISKIKLAAQDVSKFLCSGAYTGEISAEMLKDVGAEYVIVGHSERRMFFHETNHTIAKKLDMAIDNGLIPIFCFGEEKLAREQGKHLEFLVQQLQLLHLVEAPIKELVIAYEPVWAVGTGRVPNSMEIAEVMSLINGFVQNYLPHAKITTVYGGSVTSANIEDILSINNNEGVLVGGASLDVNQFKKICSYA